MGILYSNADSALINPTTTRGDMLVRGASSVGRLALPSATGVVYSDGTDLVAAPTDYFCYLSLASNQTVSGTTDVDWTVSHSDTEDIHSTTTNPNRLYMPLAGVWCIQWGFRNSTNSTIQGWVQHYTSAGVAWRGISGMNADSSMQFYQVDFINCTDPGNATDQTAEYVVCKVWNNGGDLVGGDPTVGPNLNVAQCRMFHMPGMSRLAL